MNVEDYKTNVKNISNLNELAMEIGSLDEAVPVDVYYKKDENYTPAEQNMGVFNSTTGKLATIASDKYQIIQHNDVVRSVVNSLGRLNLDVKGKLYNFHNKIRADLLFSNKGIVVEDDAEGIQVGISFINSYDKTTSFRLEMFGMRLVCDNGMRMPVKFGVREVTAHYGKVGKTLEEIEKITEIFVNEVINNSKELQILVSDMMKDSVEWETMKQIIRSLVKIKKHRKELYKRLGNAKTRWDLYNSVTSYMTHGEQLSPNVQAYLEGISKKLMTNTSDELFGAIEVPVKPNV